MSAGVAWFCARLLEEGADPAGLFAGRPLPAGGTAIGVAVGLALAGGTALGSAAAARPTPPGLRRRARNDHRAQPIRPASPIEPKEGR